jgi:beta-glucosidase
VYWIMTESRSDNEYGHTDSDADEPFFKWSDILLFPARLLIVCVFGIVFTMLPVLGGIWLLITPICSSIKARIKSAKSPRLFLICLGTLLAVVLALWFFQRHHITPTPATHLPRPTGTAPRSSGPVLTGTTRAITILVDDFKPQPYQGESVYYFNRLGGDRGAVNYGILDWGNGQVTTTISSGNSWGGIWMSLNHPIREGLPIDFSEILPPQILPAYQSQITGITVRIARGIPNRTLRLELKHRGELHWRKEIILNGGRQVVSSDLPALGNVNELVWVLDHASVGDYVVLDSVSFTATTEITDTATAAFVWSYGMLLNNWNPTTALVRDKAKDASGEFDAIQATASLAAATAVAEQLGIVERADAVQIVGAISDTLLLDLPRFHGVWPHWVKISPTDAITIVYGTEWSSVDTVIVAIALLDAQHGLGMDTSGVEQMLQAIDWNDLVMPGGISHGYTYTGDRIPYAWDVFGGESWLVELAYTGVTGQVAPITYPAPPTANGSGFIDELAWLFVSPPYGRDYWGTDWTTYRLAAADAQILHYPTHDASSCFAQLDLFGLSASEVPYPSIVSTGGIYQAFGIGGRFASPNDGSDLLGAPVVVPHYAAMIASLRPDEAVEMWNWLIDYGCFTPLNNAESLTFLSSSGCDPTATVWNQLKGSWSLSLQALGWGRYVAERDGQVPVLWQATTANPLLRRGYLLLVPDGSPIPSDPLDADVAVQTTPTPDAQQPYPGPDPHPVPGKIEVEDYDIGGEGVAHHDTTLSNEGGEYRSDYVDIQSTRDVGGGFNVGWIEEGEWLAYTVDVAATAMYDIQVRVASAMDSTISKTLPVVGTISWTVPLTRVLHVEFDGTDVSGPMTFVATGGWHNWVSVFARRIPLTEGRHVMRIAMDSGGLNVNWISFAESLPAGAPPEETVAWLTAQMTMTEKIAQLHGTDWMDTADNTRLGIPGFRTADGPHGLRGGKSTSFPVGVAMAATWEPELLERVGIAMGKEFRGRGRNQVLGPCMDITRDPRNGRSPESSGEEPYLAGKLGAALVRGIQSTQAIATVKHFAATNHQCDRRITDHKIDARTWREFYGLPFRAAVQQGGARSIMSAYNWIDGRPSSANRELLTRMLRYEWGYRYYVISDWASVYTSAAEAINAGCDVEMPHIPGKYPQELSDAIASREVITETLDGAVKRVLQTKLAAGLLDDYPPGDPSAVCSQEHRDLALEVAQKSIVLLKNEGDILPLNENELGAIALIGPSADVAQLDGIGSSVVEPCYAVTPRQGIENRVAGVAIRYSKGCDINSDDTSGFPAAVEAARDSDVVVFVGGLDSTQEGEELDRASGSVQLPGQQQALINELAAANPNVIVVLESGGIVALEQCFDKIKGLIYVFYSGQEGGNAVADILFGNVNPSGKLPVTMPRNDDQLPAWDDFDFTGDVVDGFGYRRFDSLGMTPQYAFGYGLSYTTFEYGNLIVTPTSMSGKITILVRVDVTNTGEIAGDEVVQLYLSADFADPRARGVVPMPVKQLRGFERLPLTPGQTESITFILGPEELSFWSISDDAFRVEAGAYTVRVGGSSDNLPLSGTFELTSPVLYDSTTGETSPARFPVLGNMALHRPVTCSSIEGPNHICSNAVDGDLTTRWSSKFGDPQWIYVDLGAWQRVERMILRWETAYGKAYQIQISDDATDWTDVYSTTVGDGEVDNLDVSCMGRYVRMHGTQRGTGWGNSLWEFEVYGQALPDLPAAGVAPGP